MIREKSCGAVIFRMEEGERKYLILRSTKGHTSLCKGHVERNETERQTARGEILEVTGLEVAFLEGFREVIAYSPSEGHIKDVVFFAAEWAAGEPVCQPEEVAEIYFLPYAKARKALTHASDRQVLDKAEEFLNGR